MRALGSCLRARTAPPRAVRADKAHWQGLEALEPRLLLSATFTWEMVPRVVEDAGGRIGVPNASAYANVSVSVDNDNSRVIADTTGTRAAFVPVDDGVCTAHLVVTDDDGGGDTDTAIVTVTNAGPQVEIGADRSVDEGQAITFIATVTDAGDADQLITSWRVIDRAQQVVAAGSGTTFTHTPADNGTFILLFTATDDEGLTGSNALILTVNNVAPDVDLGALAILNEPVPEGTPLSFDALFDGVVRDPGHDDLDVAAGATYLWQVERLSTGVMAATGSSRGFAFVLNDQGLYRLHLSVTDDDGARTIAARDFTVANAPPVLVVPATIPAIDEDRLLVHVLDGFLNDPGDVDWTATADYGDGGPLQPLAITGAGDRTRAVLSHQYVDAGAYTITIRVTDDDGATGAGTLSVQVRNLAPVLAASADAQVDKGSAFIVSGTANDPGADAVSLLIDFGDGTRLPAAPASDGTFRAVHVYSQPGDFTWQVIATDGDGGRTTVVMVVTVIDSPAVAAVLFDSTQWRDTFRDRLRDAGLGDGGYAIPAGSSAPFAALPWTNVDRVRVRFTQSVVVSAGDLRVAGVNAGPLQIDSFAFDAASDTYVWTLAAPIATDKLLVVLDQNIVNTTGAALNGERVDALSRFPSGDAGPGGAFRMRVNVVAADANQDGATAARDLAPMRSVLAGAGASSNQAIFCDLNGDGSVDAGDVGLLRARIGQRLPDDEPADPGAAAAATAARRQPDRTRMARSLQRRLGTRR